MAGNGNDPVEPGQQTETAQEKAAKKADLRSLLSMCRRGWTITIRRAAPTWCDGYLERLDADPDSPIDLEDIRREWGGRRLILQVHDEHGKYVGQTTEKFPDPPRWHGKQIPEPDAWTTAPADKGGATPPPNPLDQIEKIFGMAMDAQKENAAAMRDLMTARVDFLESRLTAANGPPEPPEDGLAAIEKTVQTLAKMEELRSTFGGNAEEPGPYDGMMKQFFDMQLEKEKMKMEAEIERQKDERAPPIPTRSAEGDSTSPARPQTAPKQNPMELLDQVDDTALAVYLQRRFGNMPPEQKAAALSMFLGEEYELERYPEEPDDDGEPTQPGQENSTTAQNESGSTHVPNVDSDHGVSIEASDRALLDESGQHPEPDPIP